MHSLICGYESFIGCFCGSKVVEVTWESEGESIDHVELSYRFEGEKDESWETIAPNLANTGSYSCSTAPCVNNDNCFL